MSGDKRMVTQIYMYALSHTHTLSLNVHMHLLLHLMEHTHSVLPEIIGRSGLVTILENDPTPFRLSYSISGSPPPYSYRWLRDGTPFFGNGRVKVVGGPRSSLEVRGPVRTDSGTYTLVASSTAGQATLTVELQIARKVIVTHQRIIDHSKL